MGFSIVILGYFKKFAACVVKCVVAFVIEMAANKRVYSLKEVVEQFQNAPDDDFDDSGNDIDADSSDDENLPTFLTGVRSK